MSDPEHEIEPAGGEPGHEMRLTSEHSEAIGPRGGGPASDVGGVENNAESALRAAELEDLEVALKKAQGRKSRHAVWIALGISPAAILPAFGLLLEGSVVLVVVLLVMVCVYEIAAWFKARAEVQSLEVQIRTLLDPDFG